MALNQPLALFPLLLLTVVALVTAPKLLAQAPSVAETVRAIKAPRNPLPSEAVSAGVTRFSFMVYGDTRGRRDGFEPQYEHSLVVNAMVAQIKKLEKTDAPVRFVIQTGDGVANGRISAQWNVSFVDLINKLTQDGGVPYYLAPGNHDLTSAATHEDPQRQIGLKNYLDANAMLLPPDGAPRRLTSYPVFAFGYGNTFVIALDSNIAGDEKQFAWVKAQLESLDRQRYTNVVVYGHHPVFSSGPHGGALIEKPTQILRDRYLPLFRQHRVKVYFGGHDHMFEHWVERYEDALGGKHRLDLVLTGGGGAPLYAYAGDPDIRPYVKQYADEKVALERLAKPPYEPGDGAYHYLLVRVDGEHLSMEVVGVDWGRDYRPYRSNKADLSNEEK